jgi:hypothetical protein
VTTAIVSSHHAHSAPAIVSSYRSALIIVTGISAAGLAVIVSAVRRSRPGEVSSEPAQARAAAG